MLAGPCPWASDARLSSVLHYCRCSVGEGILACLRWLRDVWWPMLPPPRPCLLDFRLVMSLLLTL
jgi:hypothetical protein